MIARQKTKFASTSWKNRRDCQAFTSDPRRIDRKETGALKFDQTPLYTRDFQN